MQRISSDAIGLVVSFGDDWDIARMAVVSRTFNGHIRRVVKQREEVERQRQERAYEEAKIPCVEYMRRVFPAYDLAIPAWVIEAWICSDESQIVEWFSYIPEHYTDAINRGCSNECYGSGDCVHDEIGMKPGWKYLQELKRCPRHCRGCLSCCFGE